MTSYETWCQLNGYHHPWPASLDTLLPWVLGRLDGDIITPRQKRIKASTLSSYLSGLRAVHTEMAYSEAVFDLPLFRRLLAGGENLATTGPNNSRQAVSRTLLTALLSSQASAGEDVMDTLALNAAFSIAFAGFLRMGEFTHDDRVLRSRNLLQVAHLTVPRVAFGAYGMTLTLPRSKADTSNLGVTITIAPAGDEACAVSHMANWLTTRPPSGFPDKYTPLFELRSASGSFSRTTVLNALNRRLLAIGQPVPRLTGHSFRKGAAQHAADLGLHEADIMMLGRWASDSVKRYYKHTPAAKYDLSWRFQRLPTRF